MEFEIVVWNRDDVHASVNGVISAAFARKCTNGEWAIMVPQIAYSVPTRDEAVRRIARALGDWYTITQAAERLVELGAFDSPPSAQMTGAWCRAGKFPGAVKILGAGGRGGGGAWRISVTGLEAFIAERREQ